MPAPDRTSLDTALIAAHDAGDAARLARLYAEAAGDFASLGDIDAACFFDTHAYVFALEAGLPEAAEIANRLKTRGRI